MRYNQWKAVWAITRGSLRAIRRSPSAIVFSFAFPFVFILVFGFIGESGKPVYKVTLAPGSDTANELYRALRDNGSIRFASYSSAEEKISDLQKGKLVAELNIVATADSLTPFTVQMKASSAGSDKWPQLRALIASVINDVSDSRFIDRPAFAKFEFDPSKDVEQIRPFRTIDFILPGQLGFSLLSSGVFGVAFMFFSLRNNLVLKRFFATPINRAGIVMGEGLSRIIFQMITAVVIILAGYFFFGFTLVNGWITFLEMMVLSFLGLVIFMGFGFIVSGIATSESSIPPIANIITLPQFLMGGTFFPVESFPKWLQPVSNVLPLTHLNNAMRSIAFEGQSLWDIKGEIGILLLWGAAAYLVAVKVFRWE